MAHLFVCFLTPPLEGELPESRDWSTLFSAASPVPPARPWNTVGAQEIPMAGTNNAALSRSVQNQLPTAGPENHPLQITERMTLGVGAIITAREDPALPEEVRGKPR